AYGGVFKGLGIVENTDLGMVMATLGLLCAVTVGMVWVNIGLRKGWCQFVKPGTSASLGSEPHLLAPEQRTSIGSSRVPASGINALAFQFAMLMAVITLGTWAFKFAGRYVDFYNHIPGNFIGVIAAVVLWPLMKVVHLDQFVDRKTCSTISGFSLEILIVAAVSTMNLKLVSIFIKPILIHFAAIVTLTSVICFWYNRKISADQWFEKAIFVFGQATGTTPSGLALVRTIDPDSVACPGEAHGIASGFGIPVTFWIPALMPVLAVKMPWAEVGIGALGAAVFLVGGWLLFRKDVRKLGR
ncbi:MAG: hypothetical protein IJ233_07405, partial [Pyramidobacter sp.]|nr:hypothetical protein [Pyramidobacter sp.]